MTSCHVGLSESDKRRAAWLLRGAESERTESILFVYKVFFFLVNRWPISESGRVSGKGKLRKYIHYVRVLLGKPSPAHMKSQKEILV